MLALMLGAMAAWPARAETDAEKKQRAKQHYEIATRFYDVGKYGEAIGEYEAAYLLTGDPALLYNIGQAYRLWDHPDDAIRVYKNYLRQRPDAVNRADVERKIADLERVVEEKHRAGGTPVEPTALPPGQGMQPPVPPGGSPPTGIVLPPVPPPVSAPAPASVPAPGPAPEPSGEVVEQPGPELAQSAGRPWLAYGLLGLGGASFVAAALAGMVGASKAKKLQDASENRDTFDPAVETNGKTANAVAVVSGLVGLAAGGVGGYLWWRDRKAARASVTLVPAVAPAYAGASALVSF
jgi:tetratricopeptide (TPR) repeat protein